MSSRRCGELERRPLLYNSRLFAKNTDTFLGGRVRRILWTLTSMFEVVLREYEMESRDQGLAMRVHSWLRKD